MGGHPVRNLRACQHEFIDGGADMLVAQETIAVGGSGIEDALAR